MLTRVLFAFSTLVDGAALFSEAIRFKKARKEK